MNRSIQTTAGKINSWLLPLLAFALPVSTSAVTVIAVLIALCWVVEADFKRKLGEIRSNKVCVAVLLYLGLYVIGLLWSEDFSGGMGMFRKQWKLLMMPIFLTALPWEDRKKVIYAYLAGLVVMMTGTYLAWFDLIHYGGVTPEHPTRRMFHVVYNPMLAFGFYLVMHELLWEKKTPGWRAALTVLALLMAFNMFVTEGRSGQVAFFFLLGVLLLQYFRKNILWGMLLAGVGLPLLFAAGYKLSPTFHNRVHSAWEDVAQFNYNPQTSIGHRIHFWKISWEIIKQNPLIGVGTCDFESTYWLMNREISPRLTPTDNPHNQYVLVLSQFGILGLAALLGIFIMQLRQGFIVDDSFKRIRLAFPVFFLLIMLSESYILIFETGFLFSLFSAVLYKKEKEKKLRQGRRRNQSERYWLILSYRSGLEASACSQHIDDRLPFFMERGVTPVLLTGTIGKKSSRWLHFRTLSIAPSGIRFELRHYLRKRFPKRWQFKLVETVLLLPVFPFYLLEKIIINLESEWSWFFTTSVRGYFLCRRFQPEVIYSTGGTASAHVAAGLISRMTRLPWLAETQDPLVHDHEWRRGGRVKAVYTRLEKSICKNADVFLFLAKAARENMSARSGMPGCGRVIYPGANPSMFQSGLYKKSENCHFAHFGTLNGTRNLIAFLKAVRMLINANKIDEDIVRVDIYGSLDVGSSKAVKELKLENLVTNHGIVSRKDALSAMQKTDCLLLIQNTIFFSSETIPSKVYEYMLTGRPILGLVHHNDELDSMLLRSGNFSVPADQAEAIADAVEHIIAMFKNNSLSEWPICQDWTVLQAVDQLLQFGDEAKSQIR